MFTILASLILFFVAPQKEFKEMDARVTVYYVGQDKWGSMTSTQERAIPYKTAAVDPKVIPYGTVIHIPELGLKVRANDTGGAVKKRTASKKMGRNCPVVDVFVGSRKEGLKCMKRWPAFTRIIIYDQD